MDTKTLWLGVLLVTLFVIIINWKEINDCLSKDDIPTKTNKEGFKPNLNSAVVNYEYDKQETGEFPETIYEKAIRLNFKEYPALICNLIPTMNQ